MDNGHGGGKPPTLEELYDIVMDSCASPNTRRAYASHLQLFLEWINTHEELSKPTVLRYLRWMEEKGKSVANRNVALAAIRKLVHEASDAGVISGSAASSIDHIKQGKRRGAPTGRWLPLKQAQALLLGHNLETLKGKRDRVIFALLLECGLRREEAAALQVEQIQQHERRWVIADLEGKGGRTRTVPVPKRAYAMIREWLDETGITSGYVLRPINKSDKIETTYAPSMTAAAVYKRVIAYTEDVLGKEYRPHDLRRSFAKIMRKHGAELDQIQQTLGHSTTRTTQIYLGEYQDLENAPCDVIDIQTHDEQNEATKGQRR